MALDDVTQLYISIRGGLARAVTGIVPPKEVEDIVQETYVRACQARKREDIRYPRAFLYKTARNLALDYAKRAETRLAVDVEDENDYITDEESLEDDATLDQVVSDEEFSQFCEAVRQLPVQCRRTFVLKKVYGYSIKEIASELNISVSTVQKHLTKGAKRCLYFMLQIQEGSAQRTHVDDIEKGAGIGRSAKEKIR